jgi:hypothetical protein
MTGPIAKTPGLVGPSLPPAGGAAVPYQLAALATRATDALRDLLTQAEEVTRPSNELDRTEPPPELYRAARELERWRERLG